MKIFEIKASADVVQQGNGTGLRRRTVKTAAGEVTFNFGKDPIYLRATELPPELAGDDKLRKTEVTAAQVREGFTVTDLEPKEQLKSERIQEPAVAAAARPRTIRRGKGRKPRKKAPAAPAQVSPETPEPEPPPAE